MLQARLLLDKRRLDLAVIAIVGRRRSGMATAARPRLDMQLCVVLFCAESI